MAIYYSIGPFPLKSEYQQIESFLSRQEETQKTRNIGVMGNFARQTNEIKRLLFQLTVIDGKTRLEESIRDLLRLELEYICISGQLTFEMLFLKSCSPTSSTQAYMVQAYSTSSASSSRTNWNLILTDSPKCY